MARNPIYDNPVRLTIMMDKSDSDMINDIVEKSPYFRSQSHVLEYIRNEGISLRELYEREVKSS